MLAGVVHRPGTLGAPLAKFDHAYDIRGNLSALTELSGKKTFAYDAIERLTGVTQTIPAPASEVESYAYDPEGNRLVTHLSPSYVTDDADRVRFFAHVLIEKPLRTFSEHAMMGSTPINGAWMAS